MLTQIETSELTSAERDRLELRVDSLRDINPLFSAVAAGGCGCVAPSVVIALVLFSTTASSFRVTVLVGAVLGLGFAAASYLRQRRELNEELHSVQRDLDRNCVLEVSFTVENVVELRPEDLETTGYPAALIPRLLLVEAGEGLVMLVLAGSFEPDQLPRERHRFRIALESEWVLDENAEGSPVEPRVLECDWDAEMLQAFLPGGENYVTLYERSMSEMESLAKEHRFPRSLADTRLAPLKWSAFWDSGVPQFGPTRRDTF